MAVLVVRTVGEGNSLRGCDGLRALGDHRMESGRKQMPKIYAMAGRNLGARGLQTVSVMCCFPPAFPICLPA